MAVDALLLPRAVGRRDVCSSGRTVPVLSKLSSCFSAAANPSGSHATTCSRTCAHDAPSAAPSHARRSTLSAPGQDQLLGSGGVSDFVVNLSSRPKVLVVCDRWLEDSCTGSSP